MVVNIYRQNYLAFSFINYAAAVRQCLGLALFRVRAEYPGENTGSASNFRQTLGEALMDDAARFIVVV